jgi:hypothetical protein
MEKGRAMQAVQVSHDELLMLLGFLRLPMPLALGTDPMEEYTDETLNAALSSALTSLMARDYLIELPTDTTPPKLLPQLEHLIRLSAQAESCLMVALRTDAHAKTIHYSLRGTQAMVHTSPRERVHRLEPLASPTAIVDHLAAVLEPPPTLPEPLTFTVSAEALGAAVDQANAGQVQEAQATLHAAGAPESVTMAFAHQMRPPITRAALVALRNVGRRQPLAESVVILRSATSLWYAADDATESEDITISAVDMAGLHARLATLVATMQAH